MTEKRWTCWADHAEDITEQVLEAQKSPAWVFRSSLGALLKRDKARTVMVECSRGHRNVIELAA